MANIEIFVLVAAFNAVLFYCAINKWKMFPGLCVFCAFGWASIIETTIAAWLKFFLLLEYSPWIFAYIPFLWIAAIVFYIFIKMGGFDE